MTSAKRKSHKTTVKSPKDYTNKQMGNACEMLVASEKTLAGVPAVKMPDNWPCYDVIAQPIDPTLRAHGITNWDFSASKVTPVTEKVSVDFRAEFFNVFNRVQFAPPTSSFGGASFGLITSQANNPRQIQFSLRASF